MKIILILILYSFLNIIKAEDSLLKGTIISSNENSSLVKYDFDNRFNTQFKSIFPSNGWVRINFREQEVIVKIEWGRNETYSSSYLLGIFEGANKRTFKDAFPLYMITNEVIQNVLNTINIMLKKSIQYFRYIGPMENIVINNINIYSITSSDRNDIYYKPSNLPLLTKDNSIGKEPIKQEISATINIIIYSDSISDYSVKFGLKGSETLNKYKNLIILILKMKYHLFIVILINWY